MEARREQMPSPVRTRTELVVLQATPFCNVNCSYCYLPDRTSPKRIADQTLKRTFEWLFTESKLSDPVSIVWHAGEPLVLPISFYEMAFRLAEQCNTQGVRVVHSFQTNGTLINQDWCDFIKHANIKIGVSLDGPRRIHDAQRVDRAGRGTFDRALRGIQLLQQNQIEPSIIMVLTQYALDYPDEIWHFFAEHGLTHLAFNVEEIEGVHKQSSLAGDETFARYKRFFRRLLELREQCEPPPFVRELDRLLKSVRYTDRYADRKTGGQENEPLAILSFDYEGNVSTFSPELLTMNHPDYGNFRFANVFDGTLEDMLTSQKFGDMNAQIQRGVSRCRASCQYFAFCGGGAPSNKLCENNAFDSTETMHCKLGKQAIVDAVLDYLEDKYALPPARNLSPLERVVRLQERGKGTHAKEGLSAPLAWSAFDDWPNWGKY
jgi:uncharacterized protein